jgi:hypothetical protein
MMVGDDADDCASFDDWSRYMGANGYLVDEFP